MEDVKKYFQDADAYYKKAFSRNIGLLTEEEQKKLKASRIAIVGMGGVGGFHLTGLIRLGIGKFNIADMDAYEIVNIQRQCGAFMDTIGENKSAAMKKMALAINPHLEIQSFEEGISSKNVFEFVSGCDLLIDGIDFFSIDQRRLMFNEARKKGIYAVTAGPLGFGSAMLVFSPQGMSFDEYFDINDKMSYLEKIIAFGVGLAPAGLHLKYLDLNSVDINSKKGPSLVSACNLCSVLASTEALKIILKRKEPQAVPYYFQFDPYCYRLKKGRLLSGNRNIIQKVKRWYLLKKFSSSARRRALSTGKKEEYE